MVRVLKDNENDWARKICRHSEEDGICQAGVGQLGEPLSALIRFPLLPRPSPGSMDSLARHAIVLKPFVLVLSYGLLL